MFRDRVRTKVKIPLNGRDETKMLCLFAKTMVRLGYSITLYGYEIFWYYGDSKEEWVPCIKGNIFDNDFVMQGWLYNFRYDLEYNLKFTGEVEYDEKRNRIKSVMKLVAYLIKCKK